MSGSSSITSTVRSSPPAANATEARVPAGSISETRKRRLAHALRRGFPAPLPRPGGEKGIGLRFFMIAAGAILDFAVKVDNTNNVNWNTVGVILMVVGAIGLVTSLIFWNSWGGVGRRRTTYVDEGPRY